MRKKRKYQKYFSLDENLINLTPLIDVVFVVLISFIIIAPLLEVDHVNLASATVKSDKNISKTNIILKVKEDNSILFNNRLVTLAELSKLLKEKNELNSQNIPQLYHDKKAYFGTYQNIKNIVEAAGFEQMDIILQPD
jgi:biopolymer transport protein ExbD